MDKIFQMLESLSKNVFLSGNECTFVGKKIPELFSKHDVSVDNFGNLMIIKKSNNPKAKNILIEAHLDTIGLCVKEITEGGFLTVCPCGGFDKKILAGTEFYVISENRIKAIATSIPPHLLKNSDQKNNSENLDIYLDCGFSSEQEARNFVRIGAPVVFAAPCQTLYNGRFCAPGLDNKAAVLALLLTLEKANSPHNLCFLFSVGEETTSRGVKNAPLPFRPDVAFVVDAGFALTKGLNPDRCIIMDKGPSVSLADTLSRAVAQWVVDVASKEGLPLQIVVEPGGTGTSTTALQLRMGGIPGALISIPLKYMHTPSEIVSVRDIVQTVDLLCALVAQKEFFFGEVNLLG